MALRLKDIRTKLPKHHSIPHPFPLHLLKVRVRLVGVEDLVAVHYGDEVFGGAEVDDVVRVAGKHVDALDVVA